MDLTEQLHITIQVIQVGTSPPFIVFHVKGIGTGKDKAPRKSAPASLWLSWPTLTSPGPAHASKIS